MEKELMMDRAGKKLQKLHAVIEWLMQHWTDFPGNLFQLEDGEAVPFDIKAFLYDIVCRDFADAITPAIAKNWHLIAKHEGVVLPDSDSDEEV